MKEREPHAIGYAVLAVFAAAVGLWLGRFAVGTILSPGLQLFAIFGVLGALTAAVMCGVTAGHIYWACLARRSRAVDREWHYTEQVEAEKERAWMGVAEIAAKIPQSFPVNQAERGYDLDHYRRILRLCYEYDTTSQPQLIGETKLTRKEWDDALATNDHPEGPGLLVRAGLFTGDRRAKTRGQFVYEKESSAVAALQYYWLTGRVAQYVNILAKEDELGVPS